MIKKFINTLSIREREVEVIDFHKTTDEVLRRINGHLCNIKI
jgi:hypothetical protein